MKLTLFKAQTDNVAEYRFDAAGTRTVLQITIPGYCGVPTSPLYVTQHPDLEGDIVRYDTEQTPKPAGTKAHIESLRTDIEERSWDGTPTHGTTTITLDRLLALDPAKPIYITQEQPDA